MADEMAPIVRTDGQLETYTHSELLLRGAHSGLIQLIRTVEKVREPEDLKGERLAAEMGAVCVKSLITVQAAELRRAGSDNMLLDVLKAIAESATKKAP